MITEGQHTVLRIMALSGWQLVMYPSGAKIEHPTEPSRPVNLLTFRALRNNGLIIRKGAFKPTATSTPYKLTPAGRKVR